MKIRQIVGMAAAAVGLVFVGSINMYMQQSVRVAMEDSAPDGEETDGYEDDGYYYDEDYEITFPEEDFIQRIDVQGEISRSASYDFYYGDYGYYDHQWTLELIDELMENEYNKGILLYIDSPGGAIYESDELYLKLMRYREKTGRPVRAYLASEACSGGYYVAMAADHLTANRNGLVGSIGVIVTVEDYSEMLKDMGISEINFVSGENKTMSYGSEALTEEQTAIYQAMVDESYEQFVDIVAEGRGMTEERVKELADGRFYTAKQALENGLVDEIAVYEDMEEAYLDEVGVTLLNE